MKETSRQAAKLQIITVFIASILTMPLAGCSNHSKLDADTATPRCRDEIAATVGETISLQKYCQAEDGMDNYTIYPEQETFAKQGKQKISFTLTSKDNKQIIYQTINVDVENAGEADNQNSEKANATPEATATPEPTPTATPEQTATPEPTVEPVSTPEPTPVPATPAPVQTPQPYNPPAQPKPVATPRPSTPAPTPVPNQSVDWSQYGQTGDSSGADAGAAGGTTYSSKDACDAAASKVRSHTCYPQGSAWLLQYQ